MCVQQWHIQAKSPDSAFKLKQMKKIWCIVMHFLPKLSKPEKKEWVRKRKSWLYNAQSTITVGLEQNSQVMGSQAWFNVHITYHFTFEDCEVEKKAVWNWKAEFLTVAEACLAIFWHTPGFKTENLSSGFSAERLVSPRILIPGQPHMVISE